MSSVTSHSTAFLSMLSTVSTLFTVFGARSFNRRFTSLLRSRHRDAAAHCGTCDRREPISEADRLFLRKILSGIAQAPRPYGRCKIAAMLVEHTAGLFGELTRLSTTGLLHQSAPRLIERC